MIQNRFKSFSENSSKKRKPTMKETLFSNIGNSIKNFFKKNFLNCKFQNCLQRNKKNTKILPVWI
jgi:hypothetical protein